MTVLRLLLKVVPWIVLFNAVDLRLRTHETYLSNLRRELLMTQTALIRHSGDQLHRTPHPSPN